MFFISGCTARGTESQGKLVTDQLRITLDRLTRIVAAEGGAPGDIVKITTYVTSARFAEWRSSSSETQALFVEYFKGDYPTNTFVVIDALAEPGLDVEIDAIAVLD